MLNVLDTKRVKNRHEHQEMMIKARQDDYDRRDYDRRDYDRRDSRDRRPPRMQRSI